MKRLWRICEHCGGWEDVHINQCHIPSRRRAMDADLDNCADDRAPAPEGERPEVEKVEIEKDG